MSSAQLLNSVGLGQQVLEIDNAVHYTSIFVLDPIESQKIRQFTETVAKAHKEEVIAKLEVKELRMDEQWTIVLTDQALYKFSPNQPLNQPRKRKALVEYFDVITDSSNPRQFTTLLYKDNLKTSVKASWQKLVGRTGAKIDLAGLLQQRDYICKSELQRDQFVWAFNKVLQFQWQSFLEHKIIPAPEIYQQHHLVIKQNKRGANQERLLVISTQCLYNVELTHNPTTAEMKWYVPLQCLQAVALEEGHRIDFFFDSDELDAYTSSLHKQKAKVRAHMLDKSKLTDTYQFLFQDDKSRADFVAVISHLYKIIHNEQGRPIDLKVLVNSSFSVPQSAQSTYTTGGRTASNLGPGVTAGSPTIGRRELETAPSAIVRRGSNLDSLIQQHRQHTQEATELLCEPLEKITHGKVSKVHTKTFSLSSDLTLRWGDSSSKYKYNAKVISVMKAQDILDQLPPEQRPNFFALRTTEKPLYLIAREAGSAATWKATVEAYSGASQNKVVEGLQRDGSSQSIDGQQLQAQRQQAEIVKLQLTVPVINGYLEKSLNKNSTNFSNTHQRYFALHADGTINWGDNPNKMKHTSTVVDVDQDISNYSNLPNALGLRFIRIKTQSKVLELLCPSQESAERWFSIANKVINPDFDMGGEESEEEHDGDLVTQDTTPGQFFGDDSDGDF